MGSGQSRVTQGIQALPRPKFDGMVRMYRTCSWKDNLVNDADSDTTNPKASPERVNVKVTVAPHLQDKNVSPRVTIKEEGLVPNKRETGEDEDENTEHQEDGGIGRPASPSFRIYLTHEEDDDDGNLSNIHSVFFTPAAKDADGDTTSTESTENPSCNEVCEANVGKTEKKGGFVSAVRRRGFCMTSCCHCTHQQPPPQ